MRWNELFRELRKLDWTMTLSICLLMAIGITFIYSASYRGEDQFTGAFFHKQLVGRWSAAWFFWGWPWWIITSCAMPPGGCTERPGVAGAGVAGGQEGLWRVSLVESVRHSGPAVRIRQTGDVGRVGAVFEPAGTVGRDGALCRAGPGDRGDSFCADSQGARSGTAAVLLPVAFFMLFAAGTPIRYLALLIGLALLAAPFGWFALAIISRSGSWFFWIRAATPSAPVGTKSSRPLPWGPAA
jgi:hypothetical protein